MKHIVYGIVILLVVGLIIRFLYMREVLEIPGVREALSKKAADSKPQYSLSEYFKNNNTK